MFKGITIFKHIKNKNFYKKISSVNNEGNNITIKKILKIYQEKIREYHF